MIIPFYNEWNAEKYFQFGFDVAALMHLRLNTVYGRFA
jgi:hypothetical protein